MQIPLQTPRALRLAATLMAMLLATLCGAQSSFDRWYVIEIDGVPSGYMHETRQQADGHITTASRTIMSIRRGNEPISIELGTECVETESHEPVRMMLHQGLGTQPTTITHEFTPDGVLETAHGPSGQSTRRFNLPSNAWLTPAAADEQLRKALAQNAVHLALSVMDPMSGPEPVEIEYSNIRRGMVKRLGQEVEGYRLQSSSSALPDTEPTEEHRDSNGAPVYMVQPLGGMLVVFRLATQEEALGPMQAAELLVSTFVKLDRTITRPRDRTKAIFVVSVEDGTLPDLPETPVQRFERIDERSGRITIDLHARTAVGNPMDTDRYLEATPMVDANDPAIAAFTDNALRDLAGHAQTTQAERLRRFVHRHMTNKDLSAGFASASEAVRTRTGDCTEHAVLLTASLRRAGIPSRVASGLIFADRFAGQREVFAYHMWSQALLDTGDGLRWVDLDATLPVDHPFDATHITLGTDALSGGVAGASLSTTTSLLGRLQISVEAIE